MKLAPKANSTTTYRGIIITHEQEDGTHHVYVERANSNASASLAWALDVGTFSDENETPITAAEYRTIREVEAAYTDAGLY